MAINAETVSELRAQFEQSPEHVPHGRVLYLMHEMSRLISTYFDQAMKPYGITHAQWWTLMHIFENEGAKQSELANIMQMGRAAAGKTIDRLERNGLVVRKTDSNDSRAKRVYLTDASVPVFVIMTNEGAQQFRDFLGDMTQEDELQLLGFLRRIEANARRSATMRLAEGP